jgi:hypothetical protein
VMKQGTHVTKWNPDQEELYLQDCD